MRRGDAKDAASVSEFVKLLVQWFQRAGEKLCLERILTMLRVAFCFVFLFFCVLLSFGFLARPWHFDCVDRNIDFGRMFS